MIVEKEIQELFIQKKWTLSLAESCTGGAVASHLTQIPDASQYFLGGIVAYSNSVKINLLNVSETLLQQKGAVSAEVVAQMAIGAINAIHSDFSIAVSGIAGPSGGAPEKPVGMIWAAIAQHDASPHTWAFQAHGTRKEIIESATNTVLNELLRICRAEAKL